MLSIYVIGCGGIGGFVCDNLLMQLSSISLDAIEQSGTPIKPWLEGAGNKALPCVADRVVLVDGDTFNPRNAIRQGAGAGSKLVQRFRKLKKDMIKVAFLQGMELMGFNAYVNPSNMGEIIPRVPKDNLDNLDMKQYANERVAVPGLAVVFLCVDNIKTRYEVSKYMEKFDDCIVFNGGNSKTSGHVTVYERSNGRALDPNLYEVYPDVRPDADKRPDEDDCTVVSPQHDQIAVTNCQIANVMLMLFSRWVRQGLYHTRGKGAKAAVERYNEVLVNIDNFTMMPVYHPL